MQWRAVARPALLVRVRVRLRLRLRLRLRVRARVGIRAVVRRCARPLPLALTRWCYVFYASKYYELVDTLLLVLRRKRVILLHAFPAS